MNTPHGIVSSSSSSVRVLTDGQGHWEIPGGDLLLRAEFSRGGGHDLLLTAAPEDGGGVYLLKDYFSAPEPVDLFTGYGARITGEMAARLAGPVAPGGYAAAAGPVGGGSGTPVGEVSKVEGQVLIIRANGVKVRADEGSPINEGDVIQTGANGSVGLTFADDSTFSLGNGGRMVVEKVAYDPGANTGEIKHNVVQGVFSFISGKVGKISPDAMKVGTPSVVIGIRGTKVAGKAAAEGSESSITLLQDDDGGVGVISVGNAAGTQVLNQINQTITATSFHQPPTPPVILPASAVKEMYGSAMSVLPTSPLHPPKDGDGKDKEGEGKEKREGEEEGSEKKEGEEEGSEKKEGEEEGSEKKEGEEEGKEKKEGEEEGKEKHDKEAKEAKEGEGEEERQARLDRDGKGTGDEQEYRADDDRPGEGSTDESWLSAFFSDPVFHGGRGWEGVHGKPELLELSGLGEDQFMGWNNPLLSGGTSSGDSYDTLTSGNDWLKTPENDHSAISTVLVNDDGAGGVVTTAAPVWNGVQGGIWTNSFQGKQESFQQSSWNKYLGMDGFSYDWSSMGLDSGVGTETLQQSLAEAIADLKLLQSSMYQSVFNYSSTDPEDVVQVVAQASRPTVGVTASSVTGRAIDGYLSGSTVFADANGDGMWNEGEAKTTTDGEGYFTLVNPVGMLVVMGGTDISTNQAFQGILKAPSGSTVITPLTSLVSAMLESGAVADVNAAKQAVAQALGVSTSLDFTVFDPVAATLAGSSVGQAVMKAAIQIQNTVIQAAAVLQGADAGTTAAAAQSAIFKSMAGVMATKRAATDLSNQTELSNIINMAATRELNFTGAKVTTVSTAAASASQIIQASNTQINSFSGQSGLTLLQNLAMVAVVSQNQAPEQIRLATRPDSGVSFGNGGSGVLKMFTTDLTTRVAAAGDLVDRVLVGGSGSDTIRGGSGDDIVSGGAGNDVVSGGAGDDLVSGGSGDDAVSGGAGNDVVSGGSGNDVVEGGSGNDLVSGGSGNDVVSGGSGNDMVGGGTGNDVVDGGSGDDVVDGGTGNDVVDGGSGDDAVEGDGGATSNVVTVIGTEFDDTLQSEAGDYDIRAGAGNDTINVSNKNGAFVDFIDGGLGTDTLIVNYAGITGIESFAERTYSSATGVYRLVDAEGGAIEFKNIESIIVSGNTYTISNSQNSRAYQSSGKTVMFCGGATDGGVATGFNSIMIGTQLGDYVDAMGYWNALNTICDVGGGNDIVKLYTYAYPGDILGTVIATLGSGNDLVMVNRVINTLDGGEGTDWLYLDLMEGGTYNLASAGASNFENLAGTAYSDVLSGDGMANVILGSNGSDQVYGGSGDDVLYGDKYYDYQAPMGDRFSLILASGGNVGAEGDDTLYGEGGNDVLKGGGGNDTLIGGVGADVLTGGSGYDVFVFNVGDGGGAVELADVVTDFNLSLDSIGLGSGILFSDISIIQGEGGYLNDAIVKRVSTGEFLAVLKNVTASSLNAVHFTSLDATPLVLNGTAGNDFILGGAGSDVVHGSGGGDIINAGAGNDVVNISIDGSVASTFVNGGAGTDTLARTFFLLN